MFEKRLKFEAEGREFAKYNMPAAAVARRHVMVVLPCLNYPRITAS